MPSTPSVRGIVVRLAAAASLVVPLMGSKLSAVPSWGNACGDGRVDGVLETFDSSSGFAVFKAHASIPDPSLSTVPGCSGQALAFGYDLRNASPVDGQSWIVLQHSFAVTDLRSFTHLRLAVHGSNLNSHDNLEVKLWDGSQLYAVTLRSMTDLPAWRPIYIDFRELHNAGAMNLATISRLEIAVVRCSGPDCEVPDTPGVPIPPAEHTGTLFLDELALVNLRPGAQHRLIETGFEHVNPNPAVAAAAAAAIAARIVRTGPTAGLIPAWFTEPSPNYNTYAMAEALLVLVYQYERTGNTEYRDLARSLADRLLSLQIPTGKINAGAWFTAHNGNLQPPHRPLPNLAPGPQPPCDGNEEMVPDGGQLVATNIDACEWVGNVGWVLIALGKLQRSGWYPDASGLQSARTRGAQWLLSQIGRQASHPALISLGIEGNISAYFGLLASDRRAEAAQLGNAVFQFGWDSTERRMKPGVGDSATALDVSGSWGVTLLRSIGRVQEALDSQGYTATVLRTTSFDETIAGYGDIAGPFTPALEFLAQGAVAGIKDADFVVQQSLPLQFPQGGSFAGAFPGAPDHWFGGALPPWSTTMPGVSPTAWMYFAVAGIDPLWETFAGAFGDLDANLKGDLLLRNGSTGQNIGWLMNGTVVSVSAFLPTIADTNWEVRGLGDFDANRKADVLWRNRSTGQNIGWLMNGLVVSLAAFLPTIADTNWQIQGVGDFNADGKADVIWRNRSTGQNIGWLMDGLVVSVSAFLPTIGDPNWEIRGVGDFDGDLKADVIWRNRSTGQNIGWLMNGLVVSVSAFLPTIADTNWEIKGVGDVDGNIKADVILRNRSTGQNIGWLMNGLTVSVSAFLPTIADTNWEIKGMGDTSADAKADVVWRNRSTGQNIMWLMNGLSVSMAAFMPTIADTNWTVVGGVSQ